MAFFQVYTRDTPQSNSGNVIAEGTLDDLCFELYLTPTEQYMISELTVDSFFDLRDGSYTRVRRIK